MMTLLKVALSFLMAMAAQAQTGPTLTPIDPTPVFMDVVVPKNAYNKQLLDPTGVYGSPIAARACYIQAYKAAYSMMTHDDIGPCLRTAFHDCGPYDVTDPEEKDAGCNGSIMYEPCKIFPQNCGRVDQAITVTKKVQAHLQANVEPCKYISFADMLQIMGAAAVAKSGGPTCELYMGRKDKTSADKHVFNLPGPCSDVYMTQPALGPFGAALHTGFAKMGFSDAIKALTVLSASHHVGKQNVPKEFLPCSKGGDLSASPVFDGHYYHEILTGSGKAGVFDSDRALAIPKPHNISLTDSRKMVEQYVSDYMKGSSKRFHNDWCFYYQEMSLLGWDTTKVIGYHNPHGGWPIAPFPNPYACKGPKCFPKGKKDKY